LEEAGKGIGGNKRVSKICMFMNYHFNPVLDEVIFNDIRQKQIKQCGFILVKISKLLDTYRILHACQSTFKVVTALPK
jgi:hypothetical protein